MKSKLFNIKNKISLSLLFLMPIIFLSFITLSINNKVSAAATTYTCSSAGWDTTPTILYSGDVICLCSDGTKGDVCGGYLYIDGQRVCDSVDDQKSYTISKTLKLSSTVLNTKVDHNINDFSINLISLYSVSYDLNGGDGTLPTDSNLYSVSDQITLPISNGVTRDGYKFMGWSTIKDNPYFSSGNYTVQSQDIIDGAIKFYAKWRKIPTITVNTASNLTYNGQKQKLLTSISTDGGALLIGVSTSSTTVPIEYNFTPSNLPEMTDAQYYYVWYKSERTLEFYEVVPTYVEVRIKPITLNNTNFELTSSSFVYNGSVQKPTVNFKSDALISGDSCEITYSVTTDGKYSTPGDNNQTIVISSLSNNNYCLKDSSVSLYYNILPKEVQFTWGNDTTLKYTGTSIHPTASVIVDDLIGYDSCNIVVEGKIEPGNYTATATGTSNVNYKISDSSIKTINYTIIPSYLVVYNSNGSTSGSIDNSDIEDTYNKRYIAGETITIYGYTGEIRKTGYTFVGWNTNKNATKGLDRSYTIKEEDIVDNQITLYAVWISGTHTCDGITYDVLLNDIFKVSIEGEYQLSLKSGNYYLTEDIVDTYKNIYVDDDSAINICLNGCVWDLDGSCICVNGYLNLTDCNSDEDNKHYFTLNNNNIMVYDNLNTTSEYYSIGGTITNASIESSSIELNNNSTFKTSNVTYFGNHYKAINSLSSNPLNIYNCNFSYNKSSQNGGAIYSKSNTNIYNSVFMYNESSGNGGAIYHSVSGVLSLEKRYILLDECTFKYNTANNGGALYLDYSIATIIDTTITDNTINSSNNGAGIFIDYNESACLTEETLILMSDNTTKEIKDIVVGDKVKSFNHETGLYENNEVYLVYKGEYKSKYFTLNFESGNSISIVGVHDLFEKSSLKYVSISEDNYYDYIGKYFYNVNIKGWDKLLSVELSTDSKDFYSIYVSKTFNSISNGMLSVANDTDVILNLYKFNEDLSIDINQLNSDIDEYGIFEFEDCTIIDSIELYEMFNIKYLNILLGKNIITLNDLANTFNTYFALEENEPTLLMASLFSSPVNTYSTYTSDVEPGTIVIGSNTVIKNNLLYTDSTKTQSVENNIYLASNSGNECKIIFIDNSENISIGLTFDTSGFSGSKILIENSDYNSYEDFILMDDNTYVFAMRDSNTLNKYNYQIEYGYHIIYDANSGEGILPIDNKSYALSKEITLNNVNNLTKDGFDFAGWSLSSDATSKDSLKYTIKGTDAEDYYITFYAVWKLAIDINVNIQEYTYSGSDYSFIIKDATADLTNFIVTYNGSSTLPKEAGTYNVIITRAEDSTYAPFSKTILNGLIINKKEIIINWCIDDFIYNAKEQLITASYTDVNNKTVDLNVSVNKKFVDSGEYIAIVSFKNNESNYILPTCVTKSYSIKPNKVTINNKDISDSKVEIIKGELEENIKVVINELSDKNTKVLYDNIKNIFGSNKDILTKVDIHLENNNGEIENNYNSQKFRVTLSIPEKYLNRNNISVIFINDDLTIQEVETEIIDNKLVFETDHFSTWAIVADKTTSWFVIILIVLGSLIILFVLLFFIWKMEYDKANKENKNNERILKFLDSVMIPINNLIFKVAKK